MKRRQCFSPGHGRDRDRMGGSPVARLVTPKPYQFKQVCDRIDQQERDEKTTDTVLMRDDATLDTSPPSEVKVKNTHVQEVEEWIARPVKETIFGFIKSNALEKAVEKDINGKMAGWNWEINLEEPCLG
jgi:hypothetical protein